MRWLNLAANALIVAWFASEAAEPGHQWLDIGGLITWTAIAVFEIRKDFE